MLKGKVSYSMVQGRENLTGDRFKEKLMGWCQGEYEKFWHFL